MLFYSNVTIIELIGLHLMEEELALILSKLCHSWDVAVSSMTGWNWFEFSFYST